MQHKSNDKELFSRTHTQILPNTRAQSRHSVVDGKATT